MAQRQFDTCQQQVEAAIDLESYNRENADSLAARFLEVVGCLEAGGFDVGAITPFEETIGNSSAPLTANWESLMADPSFRSRLQTCDTTIEPIVPKAP